jgi:hypothetical protein
MKKAEGGPADTLRPDYRRSDFGPLVRGKYVSRLALRTEHRVYAPRTEHCALRTALTH